MNNIEKELLKFWQIESVTNLDGSPKKRRLDLYEEWTNKNCYISNLHPKYYVKHKGYNLRWISFTLIGDVLYEDDGYTSMVVKLEDTENGFKVYTKNSIYTFVKTDETFNTLLNKFKS